MTTADLTIRIAKGTREHLPRVLELMRGLAEFEELLDEFRVTEDLLKRYLFIREPAAELLVGCLDKEIRGYAVILLGNLLAAEAKDDLARLKGDSTPIEIYREGNLEKKTIGELASEALDKL